MPQIMVKLVSHSQETFTVEVENGGDATFHEVKSKIHAQEGFLPWEQRLIFAGKHGCGTLADCGVKFDDDSAPPPVMYLVVFSYSRGRYAYWERHVEMARQAGRSSCQE